MSHSNSVAYQPITDESALEALSSGVVDQAPAPQFRLVPSDAEASDDTPALDWFADLTWQQIVPIGALMMTVMTGVMCASRMVLGV